MKKLAARLVMLSIPMLLLGSPESHPFRTGEHGFTITCPTLTYTKLNTSPSFGLGIRAGWTYNRSFSLGIASQLFLTNIKSRLNDRQDYGMGYFGLIAEYTFESRDSLLVSMSTLLGLGLFGPWQSYTCGYDGYSSGRAITSDDADGFTVLEPGIDLVWRLSWLCRLGLGVSYRFITGIDEYGFGNSDLSGLSLNLNFKLGFF